MSEKNILKHKAEAYGKCFCLIYVDKKFSELDHR